MTLRLEHAADTPIMNIVSSIEIFENLLNEFMSKWQPEQESVEDECMNVDTVDDEVVEDSGSEGGRLTVLRRFGKTIRRAFRRLRKVFTRRRS